jgi:predicted alpha-1,2-mannosidase
MKRPISIPTLLVTYALATALPALADDSPDDLARWVNPFVGTRNMGHTFPGATVPFGMVQLSPDTRQVPMYDEDGRYVPDVYRYCSGYQYDDDTIYGFSHTHFSGTGHSDLGDISLMPTTGALQLEPGSPDDPTSGFHGRFRHENEVAEPGYYRVSLDEPRVDAELSATTRGGIHRWTFRDGGEAHVILDLVANIYPYEGKNVWTFLRVENDSTVTGYRQTTGWARTRTVYFALQFDRPFSSYGHRRFDETPYKGFYRRFDQERNFPEMAGREIRAHFDFRPEPGETIQARVALSSVSSAGALANLQAELPHWDFDRVRQEARSAWNRELARVEIESMDEARHTVFYTALYHTMLSPIVYEDVDGSYRGLDQNVHQSNRFTNHTIFSLWDTYRALHPWLTLTRPDLTRDLVESMLAHYDQSVHPMLPVWSHYANENWCMIGYHAVSAITDAVVKGVPGIDAERALAACTTTSNLPYFDGLDEYPALGYVPDEVSPYSVSITLEFAYDDWCIARLAESVGDSLTGARYDRRARSWENLFDRSIGFMRPKSRRGTWRESFDTMQTHGQGFIEGNAWNYSLYVPHDPSRLVELMGGPNRFADHLDSLFEMDLPDEAIAHTEDITRDGIIGNYVHGNEPGHHIPYLYNWTARPWQTQSRVRMIMDAMYGPDADGLCGNDDAGQMSAWYVFSALGLYPVCPGSDRYALGSPVVERALVHLENGRDLEIRAVNQSPENVYVQRVSIDGSVLDRLWVTHDELTSGAEVEFTMGPEPGRSTRAPR